MHLLSTLFAVTERRSAGTTGLGQQVVAQALSGTASTPEQQAKFQDCVQDAVLSGGIGTPQLVTQLLQGFLNTKGYESLHASCLLTASPSSHSSRVCKTTHSLL